MKPHLGLFGTLPPVRRLILEFIFRCRTMWLPARVLLGLGAAAVAALFRATFLTGLLGPQNPFIMFIVMVPLVTMLAGFTAGATMIVCGALLTHLLLRWPVAANDYVLLGAFIMSSGVIAATVEVMHRLRTRTQQTAIDSAQARTYRAFFSQAPVAIAMFDRDMRYLASSHLWVQLFSPDEPDLLGRCHYDVFPNLPQHWIDAHRRGLAGESVLEQLDGIDTPPFGQRWFRWEVKPWLHQDGSIGGITIFAEDVTERVEKDLALRRSEARLRAFFANIGVGAVMLEADGRLVEVSDHFCTMTGFARAELVGVRTTSELTYEADREADRASLKSFFSGEIPHFISEKRYRRKDGALIWVRVTAAPICDEEGRIVQSAGIVENVTERKRAEDNLHKNEERMSLAFQATQDGIWDWNMQTDEVFYSSRWKTMLGYDDAEIEPHISAWKRLVHPDDLQQAIDAVEKLRAGDGCEHEFRMLHKDGHYVHVLSRGVPASFDAHGRIARLVGTHFDLTERRRRELQLRESEEQLAMALDAAEAGVWEMNPETGEFKASDRALDFHGFAPGTLLAMEMAASVVLPEDRRLVEAAIATTMQTGAPLRAELGITQADGSKRWLVYRGARFDGPAGSRLIGVVQDITSRRAAMDDLERSRNMLAEAEKIAHLGSFEYDAATRKMVWSEEEYQIYGLDPAGASPTYDALLKHHVHPEDAAALDDAFQKALIEHSILETEHRVIRPDGNERWVFSRARPDIDEHGRLVRYFGTTLDITDRKNTALALAESEERLRLALAAGHMAIWDWDIPSGRVLWNDEHYTMLGFAPGSITPSYDVWACRVHREDLGRIEALIEQSLARGASYNAEFRVLGAEDATRWVEAHGRVERTEQGSARRLYGVLLDITARKRADDQRAFLLQEVNHRAKNLLYVVQSIAQLTSLDATPKEFFQTFSGRLQGLAASHDLLVNAEWGGVDIEKLVRSQMPHYRSLIGNRILLTGSAIILKPAAAQALGMAIHELSTNATKYGALSTPGGVIRLSWEVEPKGVADQKTFMIEWSEESGPPVTPPTRRGFGYTVLVEMPEHLLNARVALNYANTGVVWRLSAQVQQMMVI